MFKYSVYNEKLNLNELMSYADKLNTMWLETGNIVYEDEFITPNQLEDIRNKLIERQKCILSLETGKYFHDISWHKELFKRITFLGVKYIKPVIDESLIDNEKRLNDLIKLCKIADTYKIGVLYENNRKLNELDDYFEKMYKEVKGKKPQFVFNPLEYVRNKRHPFFHKFYNSRLKNDIVILKVNDGLFKDGEAVLPGEGNGEIKEMASILLSRSFDGWFSIGPYINNMYDTNDIVNKFKILLKDM